MRHRHTVVLEREPDGQGYSVSVPALPGCVTEGDTIQQSLDMVREAIQGHLETLLMVEKLPVPDVQEVSIQVDDADEVLIYKVDVDLEPEVVKTPSD